MDKTTTIKGYFVTAWDLYQKKMIFPKHLYTREISIKEGVEQMKTKVMDKKGASGVNRAIGMVFLILIISVLGGLIFGTSGLNSTDLTGNAPAWVVTLLTVGAGVALVKLIIGRGS